MEDFITKNIMDETLKKEIAISIAKVEKELKGFISMGDSYSLEAITAFFILKVATIEIMIVKIAELIGINPSKGEDDDTGRLFPH